MSEIKRPPPALRSHAARDFHRGFMTKNLVKGAAGGARGVDFQDPEADFKERLEKAGPTKEGGGADAAQVDREAAAAQAQAASQAAANAELQAQQEAQLPKDRVETQHHTPDEERKKKKLVLNPDDPSQDHREKTEVPDEELLADADSEEDRAQKLETITRLLHDATQERRVFGALVLQDPETMRKVLGSPIRVAKHLLVLAGRLLEQGKPRAETVEYVAKTFLTLGGEFGRRAFRDFSGSIGIGAVYPLEVHERLVLLDDNFLPTVKCRFTSGKRILTGKVKEAMVLEYPEDMRITAFAIKGGGRVGYQLAPLREPGRYGLRMFMPGEFRVLVMGVDSMGFERLEEIRLQVTGDAPVVAAPAAVAAKRAANMGGLMKRIKARGP